MKPELHYAEADCPVTAPENFPKDVELHFEIEILDFFKAKARWFVHMLFYSIRVVSSTLRVGFIFLIKFNYILPLLNQSVIILSLIHSFIFAQQFYLILFIESVFVSELHLLANVVGNAPSKATAVLPVLQLLT